MLHVVYQVEFGKIMTIHTLVDWFASEVTPKQLTMRTEKDIRAKLPKPPRFREFCCITKTMLTPDRVRLTDKKIWICRQKIWMYILTKIIFCDKLHLVISTIYSAEVRRFSMPNEPHNIEHCRERPACTPFLYM